MVPARLRAHPAGASRRALAFDQLVATPASLGATLTAGEKKLDASATAVLQDPTRIHALVKSIKSKLCGQGRVIDEWRFCGDESNARELLDLLVEELTSRLTMIDGMFAHAFRLDEPKATVVPNADKLLKELLEYLCAGPALASVRNAHKFFPDDGKVALAALVRDVLPTREEFAKPVFLFGQEC